VEIALHGAFSLLRKELNSLGNDECSLFVPQMIMFENKKIEIVLKLGNISLHCHSKKSCQKNICWIFEKSFKLDELETAMFEDRSHTLSWRRNSEE